MRQLERLVMLRIVDSRWVRHLTDLDELREGIGLRAFAQQDPLIAYKKEAHEMYQELLATIAHDIVYAIYHVQLMVQPPAPQPQRLQTNRGDGETGPARALGQGQPGPQRSLLVWQRQEVQEVPYALRSWAGAGSHGPGRREHCQGRRGSGQEHR